MGVHGNTEGQSTVLGAIPIVTTGHDSTPTQLSEEHERELFALPATDFSSDTVCFDVYLFYASFGDTTTHIYT